MIFLLDFSLQFLPVLIFLLNNKHQPLRQIYRLLNMFKDNGHQQQFLKTIIYFNLYLYSKGNVYPLAFFQLLMHGGIFQSS
jgi:hypothetical protein